METDNAEVQLRIVIPKEPVILKSQNTTTQIDPKPNPSNLIIIHTKKQISNRIYPIILCIIFIIIIIVIVLRH